MPKTPAETIRFGGAAMVEEFRKDLTHLTWDEVYTRQEERADLIGAWMDALRLGPGDRVLEIGAGPGYVSLALAARVGPEGAVYAVDCSAEALGHLGRRQAERGILHIRRIVADAAAMEPFAPATDAALITMVLHHADDPEKILRNTARSVAPDASIVIGEYHPDGPCSHGPPAEHRLAPETLRAWCEQAGLAVERYRRQTPEHYMLVTRRERRLANRSSA